jgi:hypothetical protein
MKRLRSRCSRNPRQSDRKMIGIVPEGAEAGRTTNAA